MAPALVLDITTETCDKYEHKKFQGKRNYAHKKFGTRLSKTSPKESKPNTEMDNNEKKVFQTDTTNTSSKRSSGDIFRPYALPDNTPRKRKYQELQSDSHEEMEFKRFAPTHSPSPPALASPGLLNTYLPQTPVGIINPYYRLQQYQFNPQTFALILQKQRAALCMGEILKRQANLNLYNLMGQ